MATLQERNAHKAWSKLNLALGVNSYHAFRTILAARRRIWRAVR